MANQQEIVVFELITGRFVFGMKDSVNSSHNQITIISPFTLMDIMTQEGPRQAPVPYGHSIYAMNPTDKETLSFNYSNILTGPRPAPEEIQKVWNQSCNIVQAVENKIQIAR